MKKRLYELIFGFAAAVMTAVLPAVRLDVQASTKIMPDGGVFDPQYYAAAYPDVVAVLGNKESVLYDHYKRCGRFEGRQACADFDPVFYAAYNPDVYAVFGYNEAALYNHYLMFGELEGRVAVAPGSAAAPAENAGVSATSSIHRQDTMQVTANYPGEAAAAVEQAADFYVTRVEFYTSYDAKDEIWSEAMKIVNGELRDYARGLICGASLKQTGQNRYVLTFQRLSTNAKEAAVDSYALQVLPKLNKGSDYDKILAAHDFVCNAFTFSYETDYGIGNERSAYDGLYHHTTVCTGYALMFQKLMDLMGIPCYIGMGSQHAWNLVMLDNEWYHVDCTYDDTYERFSNKIYYNYFLIGTEDTGYGMWSFIPLAPKRYMK